MKNEQLKQRMRQDVRIHIPYQPPTPDQKPYDIGGTSYLTLLPAPSNRTRYAAGAAACVAVLAGTAVAVHFLSVPGPGDVSSAPALPSETTYSAVSTAQGETSGAETETTAPETDGTTAPDADSSSSATQATSQITAPTAPVKPDEPQPLITAANRISKVYGATDDPYPYVVMENGDLYHWWNHTSEEEHLQRTPEGRKYAKADKEYTNVQQYERIYVDANIYYMEMFLTRDGKLSVKGYLPTKDGE